MGKKRSVQQRQRDREMEKQELEGVRSWKTDRKKEFAISKQTQTG